MTVNCRDVRLGRRPKYSLIMSGTNIRSNKHVSSSKDERQMLALFDLHNLCGAGDCEE